MLKLSSPHPWKHLMWKHFCRSPLSHALAIAVLTLLGLFWLVEHYKLLRSINLKFKRLLIIYDGKGSGGHIKRNLRDHVSFIFYIFINLLHRGSQVFLGLNMASVF